MSKKYWLIPPSRRVSRNRGSWVLGVQAPTTTRFSPLSRMVSAICWAASVEHMKRPSSACSTLSRDRAQSTVSGISTTLPIFAPQWHMNTPTRGSSSVTSLSCGYTLSLASLPRLLWRSSHRGIQLNTELVRQILSTDRRIQPDGQHHHVKLLFLHTFVGSGVLDGHILAPRNLFSHGNIAPDEPNIR